MRDTSFPWRDRVLEEDPLAHLSYGDAAMARPTTLDPGYRSPRHAPRDRVARPMHEQLRELQQDRARLGSEIARLERRMGELGGQVPSGRSDPGTLLTAARRLEACADRGEVLEALQELVCETIGASDYLLLAHDEEGDTLWPLVGVGPNGAAFGPMSPDDALVVGALATGRCSLRSMGAGATAADDRHDVVACVPLCSGSRTVGVLILFSLLPTHPGLDAGDVELLEFMSVHAATALHLADLRAATMHRALSLL